MNTLIKQTTLIICSIILLLACQSEQQELDELNVTAEADVRPELLSSNLESKLPVIKFVNRENGGYRLVITDANADTTQTLSLKASCNSCSETISINFENIEWSYKTIIPLSGDNPFIGQVVNVSMEFFDQKGNSTKSQNFDLFVFEDGKTAVQKPIFGAVIGINTTKKDETKNVLQLLVNIENDPANEVAVIEAEITDGFSNPGVYQLNRIGPDHIGAYNFTVEIEGISSYNRLPVTLTMINAQGEKIRDPFAIQTEIQEADFTGRIRRIRIRENSKETNFRTIVIVDGDAFNQVAYVDVRIEALDGGPKPLTPEFTAELSRIDAEKSFFVFKDLSFEGGAKPIETKYTMTAQMRAADGSNLGGAFVETISADFTGRIRRIRIRENNAGTDFRIIVDENIDPDDEPAAFVQIEFNDAFGNPLPIPSTSIATLSKTLVDKQLNRYTYSPLTFEGGARPLEDIYNVTATMLRTDGTTIEAGTTRDVIVEANEHTKVELLSTQLASYDGGKTWEFSARVQTNGLTLVSVETEFTGPFEGPEPVQTKLVMEQTGEEPDGVVVYSVPMQFKDGSPLGFEYGTTTGIVYQFGTGTRSTATSSGSKPELL